MTDAKMVNFGRKNNKAAEKAEYPNSPNASMKEEVKCNHSPKGTMCEVHGMAECSTGGMIKEKSKKKLQEVLSKDAPASEWIHDFVHSKNKKFEGKSKAERQKMALGAYYGAQKEETELGEGHYHVSWGPGVEHSLIAKHAEDAVSKAKAHIIKKTPKLNDAKYADTFSKKPAVHRIKEDAYGVQPLIGGDIAKNKTDDTQSEIDMVRTELKAICNKTMHMLANMPTDHHIEPWVQAKIAAAKEMIGSVHDYMVYSDREDEQTGPDTPITFPNMANDSAAGINV